MQRQTSAPLEGLHVYFVTVVCAHHSFTSGSELCAKSRTFRAAFLLLLIGELEETVELIDRVVCSASSCSAEKTPACDCGLVKSFLFDPLESASRGHGCSGLVLLSVVAGRDAAVLFKGAKEISDILIPDNVRNLFDGEGGVLEVVAGGVKPNTADDLRKALSRLLFDQTGQVGVGIVEMLCHRLEGDCGVVQLNIAEHVGEFAATDQAFAFQIGLLFLNAGEFAE